MIMPRTRVAWRWFLAAPAAPSNRTPSSQPYSRRRDRGKFPVNCELPHTRALKNMKASTQPRGNTNAPRNHYRHPHRPRPDLVRRSDVRVGPHHLLATRITPHHPAVPSTPPHERLTPSCTARNIAFGKQQSASNTAFTPHFDYVRE
jgi:hypothetical protein